MEGTNEPVAKVKLMKMSKGHQWEISVSGDDPDLCAELARQTDLKLQEDYPPLPTT